MNYNLQKNQNAEQTYHSIRNSIVSAQHRLSTAVNSAMVTTYWEIGEQIFKACGENDRAKKILYGRMCKSSMECSSTGTADQYDVLSAYFSKPG